MLQMGGNPTLELQVHDAARDFLAHPMIVPGTDGAQKVEPDLVFRDGDRYIVCDLKTRQPGGSGLLMQAVAPTTSPVDSMQSTALKSYHGRLRINDKALALARERMGTDVDLNPTAEDAPPMMAVTTSRPAPDHDPPSSRDPNHSDDNTVRPKSNHLFQMAVF